ncbi:MAG: hypothetical protein HWD61_07270 [Parachlamydiaceae bacterium]|nr:MAG: hypothetical protein HWD61_07270 [Parachlamydiaceae bacterium]
MSKNDERKVLAQGLTLQKAREILWTLTGRDLYRMLVIEKNGPQMNMKRGYLNSW